MWLFLLVTSVFIYQLLRLYFCHRTIRELAAERWADETVAWLRGMKND